MPTYNPSYMGVAADYGLGLRVDRATQSGATLFTTAAVPLFRVAVGRVLVTCILGEITTTLGADATLAKWTGTPTTGTAVDLCANSASMANLAAAKLLVMTGTLATAMTLANAGGALLQAIPHIIAPGTIDITGSVQGVTGAVKFSIWYIPLDEGANIVTA